MGVGDGSLFSQLVVVGDRDLFQRVSISQCFGELFVDFAQQSGKVPGFEVVAGCGGCLRPLLEPPLVLLIVLEIVFRQQRFHDRLHRFGAGRNRRLHLLDHIGVDRLVDLPFDQKASALRQRCLGPCLVTNSTVVDLFQVLNRRLGQSLLLVIAELFPELRAIFHIEVLKRTDFIDGHKSDHQRYEKSETDQADHVEKPPATCGVMRSLFYRCRH